ncbi:hypothetical protein [Solidesulfovibrio magneticus]|uniref:Uncharacterized protein n=1 Tax=Solidesulfovibrio magneticus (strain ATCC 700980 / DSM 13731 / RS-1) TaxID=573370 RepID=C4XIG2_SOLM1|nr:hypothetical protein [Solidesulfovibrio magneticus]BAH76537.1 hypothetical protein DMR_30460 [Solidesulfovibrio magneticus RS-1]
MSKKAGQATNDGEGPSEKKKVEPKYNPSILRECIQKNMDAISIMEKLGITHRQTLKHCVLKLMSDDKTYYEVKGLYLKNSSRPRVNKKMELKIHLKNLDLRELAVAEGDEFTVMVENEMIILTKV